MERWSGRVAVVTGCSAGLGADIAKELIKHGLIVVGLSRRQERMEQLKNYCTSTDCKGKFFPMKCDVTNEKELEKIYQWIDENLHGISILINNAGLLREVTFAGNGSTDGWRETLNTNVLGLSLCTRLTLHSMLKYNINDGQIINMNSIYGHKMPYPPVLEISMYFATKHAVTVLTEALRQEINQMGKKIRVASLSPGYTRSEIIEASGSDKLKGIKIFETWPVLEPEDITNGLVYILSTPPHVNVTELTIRAVGETA